MELQQHTQHLLTTGGIGLLDAIQPQTASMILISSLLMPLFPIWIVDACVTSYQKCFWYLEVKK